MLKTEFKQKIYETLTQFPKSEVVPIFYNDKKYWVKIIRPSKSNLLHRLVYNLTKNPLLLPVENKSAHETMVNEILRIKELKKKGFSVPKVAGFTRDFFVLKDKGDSVYELLTHQNYHNTHGLLLKCIEELSLIHVLDMYHGAAQIKNFIIKKDSVILIDFEESFDSSIPLKEIQYRDLFLFLFSISRLQIDVNYIALIEHYVAQTHNTNFQKRLINLSKKLLPIVHILQKKYIWKYLDKDTKGVCNLFVELQNSSTSQ